MQQNEATMTPQQHAQHIAQMLQQAQQECRADSGRVSDPKAQALFETIAEVLGGAMKALEDYQQGNERAWRASTSQHSGSPAAYEHSASQSTEPPVVTDMAVDISKNEPPPKLFTE